MAAFGTIQCLKIDQSEVLGKLNRQCFDLRVSPSVFRLQTPIEIQSMDSLLLAIHLQLKTDGANPSLTISEARAPSVEVPQDCRSSSREQRTVPSGQSYTGPTPLTNVSVGQFMAFFCRPLMMISRTCVRSIILVSISMMSGCSLAPLMNSSNVNSPVGTTEG